ncbi:MAG: hypothetical protein AB2L24_17635 [Mangrovibacterium sp.]
MIKRILLILSVIATTVWMACEEKGSDPQILFENGIDSISNVFPGDVFYVKGSIIADEPLAGTFYFLQKKDANGKLEETGDRLELGLDGTPGSFSLGFNVEASTIGVKLIAEDAKGNRTVKIFKVIQGIDGIGITLEEPGFIDDINTGETFQIKGTVTSKTKITALNYRIVKGDIVENPVDIAITGDLESTFDISLVARNGWTGVLITAVNRGELVAEKFFEIKHITHIGPSVLFDKTVIEVKPDSLFTVSGRVASNYSVTSVSYVVVRGTASDPAQSTGLTGDRFSFDVNAGETVTGVKVIAVDERENEGEETLPVTILFPSRTVGNVMVHYKNIILTDSPSKGYFSFSLSPYVLGREQATANQSSVHLLYSNLFIADGNTNNGPAIFAPNVYNASTIKAPYMVEGWSTFNLTRLPAAADFTSVTGLTFDQIGDTQAEWDLINQYIKGKIGSSGVVRQKNMSVGYMFAIGFGGTTVEGINKYAIAIVRSRGGENATAEGQSTGAWLELEIKMSK